MNSLDFWPLAEKKCTKCGLIKPLSDFWKLKSHSTGVQSRCIECKKLWYLSNKDKHRALVKNWVGKNRTRWNEYAKKYRLKYPERTKKAWQKWAKNNPDATCFKSAKRRAITKFATPKWANRFFMQEAYDLARRRTKLLGEKYVVDHIVPLQHQLVCGLHVEHNMRVISERANSAKCNYWWPDMP